MAGVVGCAGLMTESDPEQPVTACSLNVRLEAAS